MSSDILKPDPSSTDSRWDRVAPNPSEPDGTSSADELSWDIFVGRAPDPMLQPLNSSADDLGRRIADAKPDPMLDSQIGEVVEPAMKDAQGVIADLDLIRTDAPLVSLAARKARVNNQQQASDDEYEDEAPSSGSSYGVILLASYASAITLGLLWILFSGRTFQRPVSPSIQNAAQRFKSRFDPGVRADCSRTISEPAAIPDSNRVALGKFVRLNDLEVTPLELREGPVELERTLTERKTKKGGQHALKLKVRFRNASCSAIFAPLDEGFIRQRLRADPESFIESASGESIISMFPLAVDSEWSITGQEFRELRPNESFESLIVSEPNAMGKLAPEMVWRIRLRTGINQLGDLGLTFRPADIKAGK